MLLTENGPGDDSHGQFEPDSDTLVSCQGTWAVAADSGPMDLFPFLRNRGCLHSYSNIVCFHDLLAVTLGKNGKVGLKFFVYIFVQTVNMFADLTPVSVVLSPNLPSVKSREARGLMGVFFFSFLSFFAWIEGLFFLLM